ncbi:hypothetical protein SprV_0200593800 [Sparganum proliferum]
MLFCAREPVVSTWTASADDTERESRGGGDRHDSLLPQTVLQRLRSSEPVDNLPASRTGDRTGLCDPFCPSQAQPRDCQRAQKRASPLS